MNPSLKNPNPEMATPSKPSDQIGTFPRRRHSYALLENLKTMPSGSITNALVRCTRKDSEAAGLFELIRSDLGLWVLELDYTPDAQQSEQLAGICRQLQANTVRLQKLSEGSVDYTLHLTFNLPEHEPIVLAPSLMQLAAMCGFNLELYVAENEDG
jgi:hypothetical protein